MIQAILFDLDGLLTDTETLHCQAYQEALAQAGFVLTEKEFADHWVRDGKGIADLCRLHHIPHPPEEIHRHKIVRYQQLVRTQLQPMPGAFELLRRVQGKKVLALVTASAKDSADCVLDTLDLRHLFKVILTADDALRRKPHPDLFLKAAELLRVPPANCLVLEDAEKGILAAHAAGMQSIAVPTPHTQSHNFSRATHVAESLAAIPDAWLDLLS